MTDTNKPYLNIEFGNISNSKKYFIKKGIIVDKSEALGKKQYPLTYYDNTNHISTNWTIIEEEPEFKYNNTSKMWSLDGISNKYECYYCDIPEECFEWIEHLKDITISMKFKINNNKTLRGDGTTNNIGAFFTWRDLYENDNNNTKPEWPTAQEYIKIYRNNNELSFGYDIFAKDNVNNNNMKLGEINELYWRFEQEPYKNFYPDETDYDNDFLYPNENEIRICRGWNTSENIDNTNLTYVDRFVPSNSLQEKYSNNWNINKCQKVQTEQGNMIRIKLFTDKNGDVFENYSFKDFKIKISMPYYCYYKNISLNRSLQTDSVKKTNDSFKQWTIKNYQYSMFTRKTQKIGNTTIQNAGLKKTNRLSNMQRLWIALSGGKNLKDENGNDYSLTTKIGRDKIINILSPLQQILWISWHLDNTAGTWKNYILPNFKSGMLNENHINIFMTEFLWLWQCVLDITPLSDNKFNTDIEIPDSLGGEKYNDLTYYNKKYYFEIIKELFGWPIPILNSVSNIINYWIPPKYNLRINDTENKLDILINTYETIQEDSSNRLNLFYTIPPNTNFLNNNHNGYKGEYQNNHPFNMITRENFVNRTDYSKTDRGWFSSEGNTKIYSIPLLGKNKDNSRIKTDESYMYRISDTPKRGQIRGKHVDILNNNTDGNLLKHGGLIVRLPEAYSKYSIPWNDGIKYIPKITKIKIELDFAVKQYDENTKNKTIPIASLISTNPNESLVYISSSNSRSYPLDTNFKKAWNNSGQWSSNSNLIKLNKINILNDEFNTNQINVSQEEAFIDNARYKLIYTIDNLPIMNPGEQQQIIDPLKSSVLVQIDYSKAKGQEHLGLKTFNVNNTASNKNKYDGNNNNPLYSIAPNIVGDRFKNDNNDFSFSVHKKNMDGLLSNENSKKHLGFYLFRSEAQSSYFFKNIKISLDIPELELENIIKETEKTNNIVLLGNAIQKAENTYDGVIDIDIIKNAKRKLSNMRILQETNIDAIETNDINIESMRNIINKLDVNKNDIEQYNYKLNLENKLSFMIMHNKFLNVKNNPNTIKQINNILIDIKQKNIVEKTMDVEKEIKIINISLSDKIDLLKEIQELTNIRDGYILNYSKRIIDIINSKKYNVLGNTEYGNSILLLDELSENQYNIGEKSNTIISTLNKTPIQLYNQLKNKIDNKTTEIINNINKKIINSNKNEHLNKIIDYVLLLEQEYITQFDAKKYELLLQRYEFSIRHINNTILVIIKEWENIKENSNVWDIKKLWFDWLGDNAPNLNWEKSLYLNIYTITTVQQFIDRVINNLNLKIKNKFALSTNIYPTNKGIVEVDSPFTFPLDSYIYTFPSTQAMRCDWISNKFIKPFIDEIWVGKTDIKYIKRENILGQLNPWNTPLGNLTIRLKNISESYNKLCIIAKNGYPSKDKWHFPGMVITNKIINTTTGTHSYPNLSYKNNINYLKKHTDIKDIVVLPPGPLRKLKNFLENDLKINKNAFVYKTEKTKYYDKSIWLYEFALKYDTDTTKKLLDWISISQQHGLSVDNVELINATNKINNHNNKIVSDLSELTRRQVDNFEKEIFTLMPTIKTQLDNAKKNYINDEFIEYKIARQLFEEHELILKNRLIMFTKNATINNLDLLLDIIQKSTDAGFNLYTDSSVDNDGIRDIYNNAIKRKDEFQNQEFEKISNRLDNISNNHNIQEVKRNINQGTASYEILITKIEKLKKYIHILNISELKEEYQQIKINKFNNKKINDLFLNLITATINHNESILQKEIEYSYKEKYNINRLYDILIYANERKLPKTNNEYKNTIQRINKINYDTINKLIKLITNYQKNDDFNYENIIYLGEEIKSIKNNISNHINNENVILSKLDILQKEYEKINKKVDSIIESINQQITNNNNLIEKNSNSINLVDLKSNIIETTKFITIINNKKLYMKDAAILLSIKTSIDSLNQKKKLVFARKTNGFYYNDGENVSFIINSKINQDIFIKKNNRNNKIITLFIKNDISEYTINTILVKQDKHVDIKNKIFLSINDVIYFPQDNNFIINNFDNKNTQIPENSIIFYKTVLNNKIVYFAKNKYFDKKTSTSMRMGTNTTNTRINIFSFNSFPYPASNMNKLHNFNMSKKNIRTNLSKMSRTGKQSRVEANTGSMGRLARLKAKHS